MVSSTRQKSSSRGVVNTPSSLRSSEIFDARGRETTTSNTTSTNNRSSVKKGGKCVLVVKKETLEKLSCGLSKKRILLEL